MATKAPGKEAESKEFGAFVAMLGEGLSRIFVFKVMWMLQIRFFEFLSFILPDLLKTFLIAIILWMLGTAPPD